MSQVDLATELSSNFVIGGINVMLFWAITGTIIIIVFYIYNFLVRPKCIKDRKDSSSEDNEI